MEDRSIEIVELLSKESDSLSDILNKVPRKNIKNKKLMLESIVRVAYILNILGSYKDAELVTDFLSNIKFENNYDYWTWLEFSLALRAELAFNVGDINKSVESVDIMSEALHSGEGLQKMIRINVHSRFMDGEMLELKSVGEETNYSFMFDHNIINLMRLVKMKVLGGSDKFNIDLLESEIKKETSQLLSILNEIGVNSILPFR